MSIAKKMMNPDKAGISEKRLGLREKLGNPDFVLNELANLIKQGDFSSSTDLISAYISYGPKYKNQEEFAEAIGTTRQTLHRMFAHDNVSMNVFFNAIEQIYQDREQ